MTTYLLVVVMAWKSVAFYELSSLMDCERAKASMMALWPEPSYLRAACIPIERRPK